MNNPRTKLWLLAAVLPLLFFLLLFWRQCSITRPDPLANLLVNGDAEAGPGSPDGVQVVSPPGWETTGQFDEIAYGANDYPNQKSPGPVNRGKNFFAGGPKTPLSTATQVIDVSRYAAAIDAGKLLCHLRGYLGGYDYQNDHTDVAALFLDSAAATLGTLGIGPVLVSDRQGQRGLLPREAHAPLPPGTRKIRVTVTMTRTEGEADDGYADNLELTLESNSSK